jgi:hypothetical protein
MQRDLQLLGGVAGTAAAQAVREKTTVKALDVAALQRGLAETGNLPARIIDHGTKLAPLRRQQIVDDLTGDERMEWLHMLATERLTEVPPIIQLCCAEAREVVPILRTALGSSRGRRRLLLARLLLWHHCADGLDPVIQEIDRIWNSTEGLPLCERDRWWAHHIPEHGVMPEMVHLLFALSRTPDVRIAPSFAETVCRIEDDPRDYADSDTRVFDYIRMVAVAGERTGLPDFIPLLERLLALPELQAAAGDQSLEQDYLVERQAYLVLYLQRALARCGRKAGLLGLTGMLSDPRALIARSALQELRALTRAEHPLSGEKWAGLLATWPEEFEPMPLQVHLR